MLAAIAGETCAEFNSALLNSTTAEVFIIIISVISIIIIVNISIIIIIVNISIIIIIIIVVVVVNITFQPLLANITVDACAGLNSTIPEVL